jgi:SAM-dependent methyltransferase
MFTKLKNALVNNVPLIQAFYKKLRQQKKRKEFKGLTNQEVFTRIYESNKWDTDGLAKGSFYSGTGSYGAVAQNYVDFVSQFIEAHKITSVTDIGCGDFEIGNQITKKNKHVKYIGCDVVEPLIQRNKKEFESENISFKHLDASKSELPKSDLITIRQVLQHLSNDDIQIILSKVSHFKYALISEHLLKEGSQKSFNKNKPTGPDTRMVDSSGVYIDKPPFLIKCKEVLRCRDDAYNKEAYIVTYLVEN